MGSCDDGQKDNYDASLHMMGTCEEISTDDAEQLRNRPVNIDGICSHCSLSPIRSSEGSRPSFSVFSLSDSMHALDLWLKALFVS